jgi:hypothetical protein
MVYISNSTIGEIFFTLVFTPRSFSLLANDYCKDNHMASPLPMKFDGIVFSSSQQIEEHIKSRHSTLYPHFKNQCGLFIGLFSLTHNQDMTILSRLSLRKTGLHTPKMSSWVVINSIPMVLPFSLDYRGLRPNRREI